MLTQNYVEELGISLKPTFLISSCYDENGEKLNEKTLR